MSEQHKGGMNVIAVSLADSTKSLSNLIAEMKDFVKENTRMYDKHVSTLVDNRNAIEQMCKELIKQNSMLIAENDRLTKELELCYKHHDKLASVLDDAINNSSIRDGGSAMVNFGEGSEKLFK